jgi:tRNA 2-thiouridine synthesizing protein E
MTKNSSGHDVGTGRRTRLVAGRKVRFDTEGFFEDFDEWSEKVFEVLACEEGITVITDLHWQVVRALRDFYAYNGRSPLNNELRKSTGISLMKLEGLFPGGIKNGARRLSGLPNPKTCN